MTDKIVGVNIQSQVIIAHRSTEIVLMEAGQRTVDVIAGILGTETDCPIQIGLSLSITGLLQAHNGTSRPRVRVILIQFERLVEVSQSRHRILLLQEHLPSHKISPRVAGRHPEQTLQICFCRLIIFLLHMRKSEIMPQNHIFGIIMQRLLVIFDGSVELTLPNTGQSSYLIRTYHKGIALDSFITIQFSPLKIFQIQFGKRSEKIRFIQVRLGINHLIEVLYRQYIILKIKRVTGNSHHPFRVYLSI